MKHIFLLALSLSLSLSRETKQEHQFPFFSGKNCVAIVVFEDYSLPGLSYLLGTQYLLLKNENERFTPCVYSTFVLGNLVGICLLFIVASVFHVQVIPDLYFLLTL